MKAGWQQQKLGQVCRLISGQHIDSKDYNTESRGVGYLTGPSDFGPLNPVVSKWTEYPKIKAASGDILITVKGSGVGKINLLDQDEVAISRQLMAVRVKGAYPRFIHAFLSSTFDHFQSVSTGAAIPGISREQVLGLEIPIPPLPEQQRIVGILDEAFDGIATAKANAEKNLQNARALFESHLQAVFTQRGEGWAERKLGDENLLGIVDGDRGANYPTASEFRPEGYCLFLNTKNVRPNGFEFQSTMFITKNKDAKLRKGRLQRGDVVMTTRGTIGNLGLYSDDIGFDNIRINSGMLIFRVNPRRLLANFLFEVLRSPSVKAQIKKYTSGAAQPQLPIKTLVKFTIPVPISTEEQQSIVNRIHSLSAETQRLESIYRQKLAALDALKKSLLDQAFTGVL